MKAFVIACAVAGSVAAAAPARASSIHTYFGLDEAVGIGIPRPNTDAAAAAFDAAVAGEATTLTTFEASPVGPFTTIATKNGTLTFSPPAAISDSVDTELTGFNTTPGGVKFVQVGTPFADPGQTVTTTATFSFVDPVDAFGLTITGLGDGSFFDGSLARLLFNDGTARALTIPGGSDFPDAEFFGFTDPGKAIKSVVFSLQFTNNIGGASFGYVIGFDDIRTASPVPEPGTLSLLAIGAAGVVRHRRHLATRARSE